MRAQTQTLILPLVLLLSLLSLSHSLPAIPDPSLLIPSSIDTNPTGTAPGTGTSTIPAFPEQSDIASLSCPLNPNDSLFHSLSLSCRTETGTSKLSFSKCCPSLAAYLYAAYSATSLQVTSPSIANPTKTDPLPVLPDDAEACAGSVDRVLREKGVKLPRGNGTCDVALCGCGIKLRRMTCQSGMFADVDGMWVPNAYVARRLERECSRQGLVGCGRCLRALNELKTGNSNFTTSEKRKTVETHDQECQLMGLTWLLMRNGTKYLQSITGAVGALMVAEATGSTTDPTVCSLPTDNMPLAVGSSQINGQDSAPAIRLMPSFYFLLDFLILSTFSISFL
ncbi:hypothetical protein LUZ60_012792 [Juncus effusus]|nr:hypothetical protein LUZ60_012792 [Juncus effusus]